MSNITISVEDDILIKVRKLAIEQHTTLTAMVREILHQFASREDLRREEIITQLRDSFETSNAYIGEKTWQREDLHAR